MKKFNITIIIALLTTIIVSGQERSTFIDNRDDKTYKTIQMGEQLWMAENLAYKPNYGNFWSYQNSQSNLNKYGYLYDYETAVNACPDGWHLPKDEEWNELIQHIYNDETITVNVAKALKITSGWFRNNNGTDHYGFSALPGGLFDSNNKTFAYIGKSCGWWSSTNKTNFHTWKRGLLYDSKSLGRSLGNNVDGHSVRCIKNDF